MSTRSIRDSREGDNPIMTGLEGLLRYTRATAIVGDIRKIRAHDVGLGDMALVEIPGGERSLVPGDPARGG